MFMLPRISPQPHTGLAFEGYHYAKQQGRPVEYNRRMFTAFFQEEQNIGNIDVLATLAGEIGLERDDFRAALDARRYRSAQQKALQHAYEEARVTAVPTFIVGQEVIRELPSLKTLDNLIQLAMQGDEA